MQVENIQQIDNDDTLLFAMGYSDINLETHVLTRQNIQENSKVNH